ncbi:MAG: lipopolysaccharide heptosyltransferase I [Dissulfurispiraceae bacterium]
MRQISLKNNPSKILVVKPSSLGDIIHSLPVLLALSQTFPDAKIHWVVAKGFEEVLEHHPMVAKLLIINKDQWKRKGKIPETLLEMRTLLSELKNESYDLVIDLQGLLRSGLIAYATRAPLRIGFNEAKEGANLFYTHKVEGGRNVHAVDRYLKIASTLGCDSQGVSFPLPLINDTEKIKNLKKVLGEYAVIIPGARWQTKRWPKERFGSLASMLNMKSVLVGSPSDAAIAHYIQTESKGKALSMAGKTDLKELISIIRGASYVISNDSGPMHIAAALGIPVIALFGPTNPVRTGPYGSNHTIITSEIDCAPCYKKKCKDIRCMSGISVEVVYNAVKTITYES